MLTEILLLDFVEAKKQYLYVIRYISIFIAMKDERRECINQSMA